MTDLHAKADYHDENDFIAKVLPYSVFTEQELQGFYRNKGANMRIIPMLYNIALPKRPNRHTLLDPGFFE